MVSYIVIFMYYELLNVQSETKDLIYYSISITIDVISIKI